MNRVNAQTQDDSIVDRGLNMHHDSQTAKHQLCLDEETKNVLHMNGLYECKRTNGTIFKWLCHSSNSRVMCC